ncbi:MAG: tRNA (cytosine(32)/uridine(32)-2'-O)-methyltransferase TrmJ [Gammaproteobacteria bacterium]
MSSSSDLNHLPIRVVLVGTSHPGNIGAVARAMKTMHLTDLRLVTPRMFPHAESTAMASGADDVLADARVCDTLEEAVADCGLVLGASARLRSLRWPQMDPRESAAKTLFEAREHPVALVFGRERTGLTNDELARCHALVCIPSNPDYGSLNLAMSVQVLCYELIMSSRNPAEEPAQEVRERATNEEMDYFYTHLERVMINTGFLDPAAPRRLMSRLRRLFGRARPDHQEVNILRGILAAVENYGDKR